MLGAGKTVVVCWRLACIMPLPERIEVSDDIPLGSLAGLGTDGRVDLE